MGSYSAGAEEEEAEAAAVTVTEAAVAVAALAAPDPATEAAIAYLPSIVTLMTYCSVVTWTR